MRQSEEIEYVLVDGKLSINLDHFEDDAEIKLLEVEFEATPRWEDDGIGSYEYWGCKGYDSHPYVSCEYHGIKWDTSKHTEDENKIIEEWLDNAKNFESLEERFCEAFTYPDI